MTQPLRVAVVKGGDSAEREISLLTAAPVEYAIASLGHTVKSCNVNSVDAAVATAKDCDVAFIALHGGFGENGTLQEAFEAHEIPYTGSGPEASHLAMDKIASKRLFTAAGLPTAKYHELYSDEPLHTLLAMAEDLGYPVVLKPSDEGSSVGVSIVKEDAGLLTAVRKALRFNHRALMEKYISGKELQISILDGSALPLILVQPAGEFYDYAAKYQTQTTQYKFDTGLTPAQEERVQIISLAAFQAVGCRDYGRVECILDAAGTPHLLEINTLPGMTATSIVPKAAAKRGIAFPQLIDKLLHLALTRA